ncbi:MAG: plasmid mobilization protein [Gemmatimonadaceae bacterium]
MPAKTQQLQIRVTPRQKAALKRHAAAAGLDVSSYVLSRALPDEASRFADLLRQLTHEPQRKYALAELNDLLSATPPATFGEAVAHADLDSLAPYLRNYVAAMVEQAAELKHVAPPAWVQDVAPLDCPHFATSLVGLRMHLLRSAPVPFKRRNIFVDSAVGARV